MFGIISFVNTKSSGSSSAGRTLPCQGRGRRFESVLPLQIFTTVIKLPISRGGGIGRHVGLKIQWD